MWTNTTQPGRPQMGRRFMRISRRIPKATNAHSEYVILHFHCNNGCTNAIRTLPVLLVYRTTPHPPNAICTTTATPSTTAEGVTSWALRRPTTEERTACHRHRLTSVTNAAHADNVWQSLQIGELDFSNKDQPQTVKEDRAVDKQVVARHGSIRSE